MLLQTIFYKQHRLTCLVISAIVGCTCAIIFNMRGRGIVSAQVAGASIALVVFWLIAIFTIDAMWRIRTRALDAWYFRAAGWSGGCLGVIVASWILSALTFPDSARIYLILHRSYIQTHWQVDPITGVAYFPLHFYWLDQSGKTIIPSDFFVLDQSNQITIDPVTHEVTSPKCPGAIYTADRLDNNIYILRHYTTGVTAPVFPCLIGPVLTNEPPPP